MRRLLKIICALGLLAGALASSPALAHGRVFFGFNFGFPLYPPAMYYPPPPVYYYPPTVVTQPTYIPPPSTAAAPAETMWYYCADSRAYYPYVKDCASPWQRVPSRPPGQ